MVMDSDMSENEQMELFPELADRKPENLGILRNGSKTMRFVAEYFLTGNATQSVLNAGYNCSRESARRMGHELLTRLDIRGALMHLGEQVRVEALVSKQSVIQSILETRKKAEEKSALREIRECDRLLAQILGMLRDNLEITGDLGSSFVAIRNRSGEGENEAR